MRLDKFLANSGIGSRSQVKKLIHQKRIRVNQEIAKSDSFNVDENKDIVLFDNKEIKYKKFFYILINKPQGYVSAVDDNVYPPVTDLVPEFRFANLFPVGRLDVDTTGTLLLTNNGDLCHKLISPKYCINKTYGVEVDGILTESLISKFEKGVFLDEGMTLPAQLVITGINTAELTIHEGKFHQVKRMFKCFDLNVTKLDRKSIAFLNCENLELGKYRELTSEEEAKLLDIVRK